MLPVSPLVCSTYERCAFSAEIIQLDDDYLIKAGVLGDGESLSHCARLSLAYRPPCRRFGFRQTDGQDYEGKPQTFRGRVSQFLSAFLPLTTFCLDLTLFMLESQGLSAQQEALKIPTSPTLSDPSRPTSQPGTSSGAKPAPPQLISEFERVHYWNGISMDPPELLYRSDLKSNPFPVPPPGTTRWSELPVKTVEGVFGTPLNDTWHIVAPKIIASLKKRGIKYSALKTVRFSTPRQGGKKTLGPIVIWIATHPNTTSAENARDASPDILNILKEQKVEGAVVEWYEGSVEKLLGPVLMRVADETNPTNYVRRPFTAALGMPIATKEMEELDAQGTVAFFFHENKTKKGDPSPRVFAVSNKHVLRKDTTVDYQFGGGGAPRQYVRVCGFRRFQRATDEIRDLVAAKVAEAVRLTEEIARLEAKEKSKVKEQAKEDEEALRIKRGQLDDMNKDNLKLQEFFKEITTEWNDIARRNIGFVDWAPSISVDVDDKRHTRDIGTVELDPQKFRDNFQGNVVHLGAFLSHLPPEISISPHKNNLQETNLLRTNSTLCSGIITPVRRGSSSPPMACSRSRVLLSASS